VAESGNDAQQKRDRSTLSGIAADEMHLADWRAAVLAEARAFDDYRQSASGAEARRVIEVRVRHGR